MRFFSRRAHRKQLEAQRKKHDQETDERIDHIQAEVRAIKAYVGMQPDLRAVNDH